MSTPQARVIALKRETFTGDLNLLAYEVVEVGSILKTAATSFLSPRKAKVVVEVENVESDVYLLATITAPDASEEEINAILQETDEEIKHFPYQRVPRM